MRDMTTYAPSDFRQDYKISAIRIKGKPDLQDFIDLPRRLNQSVSSTTFEVIDLNISKGLDQKVIRPTLENLRS
jgi:hypothetical protein